MLGVKPTGFAEFAENQMAKVITVHSETVPVHLKGCRHSGACNSKYSHYLHSSSQGNHHCVLKDEFAIANQKTQLNDI